MRSLIFSNLTTRKPAVDATGASLTLPTLVVGQQWTVALRFTERVEGTYGEFFPAIANLRAAIGYVDARPISGTWALQVGTGASTPANTTTALDWNADPDDFENALNLLSDITPHDFKVEWDSGSYIIWRESGDQVTFTPRSNNLKPVSFVRVRAWQEDGKWMHEVRLIQAPLSFTDTAEPILPDKPYVVTVADGYTDPSGTYKADEIQNLIIPPDFRGLYYFKRGLVRSDLLSIEDGAEEIEAALNKLLAIEGGKVTVTNTQTGVARIVFGGDFSGIDVEQLQVFVPADGAPPGDWTFTLNLNTSDIWAALREKPLIKVSFEVEANVYIDPADPLLGTRTVKLWSEPVTIVRPLSWEELATVQNIDWLQPPSPKTYIPFTLSQVLTGQQQAYSQVIGDGLETIFVINHNLASELATVVVRENISGGRRLRDDEYEVEYDSNNACTLTFPIAPDLNALAVFVITIGPPSVFQTGLTVTIPQVVDLEGILNDLGTRVSTLETILPSTGPAANSTQESGIIIELPETKEVLFFKGDTKEIFGEEGIDASKLGRGAIMFPAVHDATVTSFAGGALPAAAAGQVWQNNSGSVLNFGRNALGGKVVIGGYFASDGRALFAATRSGTTNSYFPSGFERELWRIFINDKMLRVNRMLDVQFGLALQLINASSNAQWMLVIEKGTAPSQSTPATTGTNLENVEWDDEAILSQRLILTQNRQTHSFGVRIKRSIVSLVDTLTLDTLLYGVWEGNDAAAPSTANFALRARLIYFDTENALASDAKGWVTYEIIPPTGGEGENESDKPKATIN